MPSGTSSRPHEMARLFREHPEALAETERLIARIGFTLDQLRYNYPAETVGNGETAQETLERLTWAGRHEALSREVARASRTRSSAV